MKKIFLCFSLILGGGLNFLFFKTYLELHFYQYIYIFLFGVFGIFLSLITRKNCNLILFLLGLFFYSIPVIYITLYFLVIEIFLIINK